MTASDRPTITPEMVERFARYLEANPTWGSLHIVLDDDNIEDGHVRFCQKWAEEHDDPEGAELAAILLTLTESQRGRLGRKAAESPHAPFYPTRTAPDD